MLQHLDKFQMHKKIKIGSLTWNLAGKQPNFSQDFSRLLLPEPQNLSLFSEGGSGESADNGLPDFYVVGLQEMVDLGVIGSVVCSKDEERMLQWEQIIKNGLNKRASTTSKDGSFKYQCLLKKVMFGCFIMLFVREDNLKYIRNMHVVKVKTGTKGMTANKGSVGLRFNFMDTSFMFMNCHLTSGQKKVKDRLQDISYTFGETCNNFFEFNESGLAPTATGSREYGCNASRF